MLIKLVDQDFMTEAQGKYLEEAIGRKESIIVSGHKGWEFASNGYFNGCSKINSKAFQVKGFDDLKKKM